MVLGGTGSVYEDTGWYLGQYKLILLGIRCYRVSKGLVCLYILKKVEIWSCARLPMPNTHRDRQQNIVLLGLSTV